jgi:hypothetical protein
LSNLHRSQAAARVRLVLGVNDQTIAADFRAIQKIASSSKLKYGVGDATEARMTGFLAAGRVSTSGSAINLNVTAIDTHIVKH